MAAATNPSFDLPHSDPDMEVWVLRAPASLDVQALLDGVTLDVDQRSLEETSTSNKNILSAFKSSDGSEYELTLGDANEADSMRLLVPDNSSSDDGSEYLIPYSRPFQRQIHLTAVLSCRGESSSNVKEDLVLAPSKEVAPKPAFGQSGNGSVDSMRQAYIPVPQRQGLKRRWAMPGSKIREASPSALYSAIQKRARLEDGGGEGKSAGVGSKEAIVSDEDEQSPKKAESSRKKEKRDKKKKDKKSKKSPTR